MRHSLCFEHILTPEGRLDDCRVYIDAAGRIEALESAAGGPYDGWLALPGMPNAHSHAFQRALAGQGERPHGDDTFWAWREAMYALAGRMDAEQLYAVACRAFADMLLGGFTSVGEFHYLHHPRAGGAGGADAEMGEAVIRAAEDTGIRLALLPVFYHSAGFAPGGGGMPLAPRQQRFAHRTVESFMSLVDALGPAVAGVAPHSLRAVPGELLADLVQAATSVLGATSCIHIHVSEQPLEVEACLAAHGCTPVEWLAKQVNLDSRWSLVHATHATAAERGRMRRAGVNVVLCPLTEAYLADGVFPAAEYRNAGGNLAIGSDSNVRIDALEELRMLEYGQRLVSGRRAQLSDSGGPGVTLWAGMALGGARALNLEAGAIECGRFADLVVLTNSGGGLAGVPAEYALDAALTCADGRSIAAVYVGGRRVAQGGRMRNEADIAAGFEGAMQALWT